MILAEIPMTSQQALEHLESCESVVDRVIVMAQAMSVEIEGFYAAATVDHALFREA
jgi:hypothetical protein